MQISGFEQTSAQAVAIPASVLVALSSGHSAQVQRLSWLQFEALWSELATLLNALSDGSPPPPGRAADEAAAGAVSAGIEAALAAAPQLVLKLAALSTRLPETELAQWPPCDVLAVASASLELNFIQPAGVRDFFSAVARLGG